MQCCHICLFLHAHKHPSINFMWLPLLHSGPQGAESTVCLFFFPFYRNIFHLNILYYSLVFLSLQYWCNFHSHSHVSSKSVVWAAPKTGGSNTDTNIYHSYWLGIMPVSLCAHVNTISQILQVQHQAHNRRTKAWANADGLYVDNRIKEDDMCGS